MTRLSAIPDGMWPMSWEAGLAILQSASGGFYIHTEDTGYRYKALKTGTKKDPFILGFRY